jgi:hypothetical protein
VSFISFCVIPLAKVISLDQWQELSEIQHPIIKLGAELSIFHPNWSKEITLANGITQKEIKDTVMKSK